MRSYLDHAATAPLRPCARDAWWEASLTVGNASSTHGSGQAARRLLEDAREQVAAVVDCDPPEVVFTSGGTESINLALSGLWHSRPDGSDAIVLPDAEHHATIEAVAALAHEGATVRRIRVDPHARIDTAEFAHALPGAAVATALMANNEVGTINDAAALCDSAAESGTPLHLDAVAAWGHLPLSFRMLRGSAPPGAGLVALSLAGHKIGAPTGVGALIVHRTAQLTAMIRGGAQQRGLRAGTPDVAGAVALAAAAADAERTRDAESARLTGLRDRLADGIRTAVPRSELLGDPHWRLPGNVHVLFPGAVGESLLFLLDTAGISASTGSACQAGVAEPSHVVVAMGRDDNQAGSVLRFSLGYTSQDSDVDAVLAVIAEAYARASGAGSGIRS